MYHEFVKIFIKNFLSVQICQFSKINWKKWIKCFDVSFIRFEFYDKKKVYFAGNKSAKKNMFYWWHLWQIKCENLCKMERRKIFFFCAKSQHPWRADTNLLYRVNRYKYPSIQQ